MHITIWTSVARPLVCACSYLEYQKASFAETNVKLINELCTEKQYINVLFFWFFMIISPTFPFSLLPTFPFSLLLTFNLLGI